MKNFHILFFLLFIISCQEKHNNQVFKFVPKPQHIEYIKTKNPFILHPDCIIKYSPEAEKHALYLQEAFKKHFNFSIEIKPKNQLKDTGFIMLSHKTHDSHNKEHYKIKISNKNLHINGLGAAGLMHGIHTFLQMMEQVKEEPKAHWAFNGLHIQDEPAFPHRGMLLDVCRHYFEKDVIKKYLDILAYYKMNTLHWHLTEDQGWRIQIDAFPKLTEIGAWRTEKDGSKYGGFYTKEDIREIVDYANALFINIIPEIELPGHAQAALCAYPQLSCTGGPISIPNDWGVFKEIYCAGNEKTFQFLETVLSEVIELFPGDYVHIGGDEAPKFRWDNCKKCKKRMKDEGLKDSHELQSYFIKRIEKFLNSKGKKLIGWDEIMEGGISENACIQSWRGMEHGKQAALEGHDVIMSPTSHCYLDYDLKSIDLKKIYSFNPIPEGLPLDKQKHILGAECNMWTEHVPDEANLDSKVLPRMIALAEVLWTQKDQLDFNDFYTRLKAQYPFLKRMGYNYGLETIPVQLKTNVQKEAVFIELKAGLDDLKIQYKKPDDIDYQDYTKAFKVNFSGNLSLKALRNGEDYGLPIEQSFETHKGLGKSIKTIHEYSEWYTAGGPHALCDGKTGSLDFRDGCYQGYWGKDFEAILHFENGIELSSLTAHFYQYNNAWIFAPLKMEVFISDDGMDWIKFGTSYPRLKPETRGKYREKMEVQSELVKTKFIRILAENLKKVPDWHEAAGSDAWIFIDELILK